MKMSVMHNVILSYWEKMPANHRFHIESVTLDIKSKLTVPAMIDTIRRNISKLRTEGYLNYECIDKTSSLYRKIECEK